MLDHDPVGTDYDPKYVVFLFRKILPPSLYSPVTYSKPSSISSVASFTFIATLLMNLSSCGISTSWMYLSVVLRLLCPSSCWTQRMSLVLAYSVVLFWRRRASFKLTLQPLHELPPSEYKIVWYPASATCTPEPSARVVPPCLLRGAFRHQDTLKQLGRCCSPVFREL